MTQDQITENIIKEAQRIEEDTEHSAKGHLNAAQMWGRVHYFLGIPMTVIAAIAGAQALNDSPVWAAGFALIAAALGGIQTFINAEQKCSAHRESGNRYLSLRNNTRYFREVELLQMDNKQATKKIKVLSDERNALNESSLAIPRCSWLVAKKDIDAGYSQYRADRQEETQP
jgi:hypothetical protein